MGGACSTILRRRRRCTSLRRTEHRRSSFRPPDRVLNAPTNEAWIDPWRAHLEDELGVRFRFGHEVMRIVTLGKRVSTVLVKRGALPRPVNADYYVAALPVEVMQRLLTGKMEQLDPGLGGINELEVRWMNGVMFYLAKDVPIVHGHTLYIDSDWALTSISQQQFWPDCKLREMGDGGVGGILSVDVSDWESPTAAGMRIAKRCTEDQLKNEVWAQLKAHLNDDPNDELEDSNLKRSFVDPGIVFGRPEAMNEDPLLINTRGSWYHRPAAMTAIDNLFLAADYVQTNTDLATMEGANEAARRAVNGILAAEGFDEDDFCEVRELWQPPVLAPAREFDRIRYHLDASGNHHLIDLDPAMPPDLMQNPEGSLRGLQEIANHPEPFLKLPAGPRDPNEIRRRGPRPPDEHDGPRPEELEVDPRRRRPEELEEEVDPQVITRR